MSTTIDPAPIASTRLRQPGGFQIARACSLDEFDQLEAGWSEAAEVSGWPTAGFGWVRACLYAFGEDATPHVVAVRKQGELQAAAPLVCARLNGIRRLFLAGVDELSEPTDLLFKNPQALARLARSLAWTGRPMILGRVPADSPSLKQIRRALLGRALVVERPQASCPFIQLDESWVEPESHFNAGRRSDFRRARRKAEQVGPITTEICTPGLHELPALLDKAFEVEAASWKGESGTALLLDPHRAVFFRQYAESACVEGMLRICFLRLGDRVAAMQVAVESGGRFWLLKVGYDAQLSGCSPGQLLMLETIRHAAESGLSSYEFLGRAEAWTRVWTETERQCVAVRIYPLGLRGLSALAADAAAVACSKWRRRS